MANTPLDINGARSWLDQNLGGSYAANGQFQPGSVFNNGVYDTSNTQRNTEVLGKAQQMGYTPDQVSQILGVPTSQITNFQSQYQPNINSYAAEFAHDASNPASYMQPNGVTNDQINGWLQSHPGATDPQIASAMQQYGVTPAQMAGATGLGTQAVTDRYNAAINGTNGAQNNGMGGAGSMGAAGYSGGYGQFGQSSPWLSAMANELGRRTNLGLTDAFNQIRSNSVGVGGLGGDRQGIAEGVATRGAMDSLQGQLANLYGTDWTNAQNRGLQQYGLDQNYNLGLGGLANQRYGQDQNFYTAQRGQDLTQLGLGANLYSMGLQNDWTGLNNASNIYNNAAGQTTSGSGSQQQGGGAMGAFGGALGGAQMANNLMYGGYGGGMYGTNSNSNGLSNYNSYNPSYGGYQF